MMLDAGLLVGYPATLLPVPEDQAPPGGEVVPVTPPPNVDGDAFGAEKQKGSQPLRGGCFGQALPPAGGRHHRDLFLPGRA